MWLRLITRLQTVTRPKNIYLAVTRTCQKKGDPDRNPGFSGGDEAWTYWPMTEDFFFLDPYNIARGTQNRADPYMNYWDGYDGRSLWQGISTCNIFLANVDKVVDLQLHTVKLRWIALKLNLLRLTCTGICSGCMGQYPIMDKNLDITASPEQVKVFRQPVDTVVNYISPAN
jgi:hypothetical protein